MDAALAHAFDATWPAPETCVIGGLTVGRGHGAGGRVSSARASGAWSDGDIDAAIACQTGWDQTPMFRVRDDDTALITALRSRGFAPQTPTTILQAPIAVLAEQPVPHLRVLDVWPPLAIQRRIWEAAGITPARQAVMEAVEGPRRAVLGRLDDRAAGVGFVAVAGEVAMLHALHVVERFRRRGLGGWMVRHAAQWAGAQGATRLAVAVSHANSGARALYAGMGFAPAGDYAYYVRSDAE